MNIRTFAKKISFQTPIIASLLISFFSLYFGSLTSRVWIIFVGLMVGVAVSVCGHVLHLENRKDFNSENFLSLAIVTGVCGIMAASFGASAIREFLYIGVSKAAFVLLFSALLFAALFVLELVYIKPIKKPEWSKNKALALLPFAALALVLVALNLENFGAWIRWDSYDYYYYFENLSYTSLDFFDNLRPANHAAYGCSVIYMVVNGIIGNTKASLVIINILMLTVGAMLFARILKKLFPHWNTVCRLAMTCVYAFSPFIFGLAWSINLEAFLIFGFVLFFWGEVEKLPLVQTFAAILICFSKETGALMLATIIVVRLAFNFIIKPKKEKSFFSKLELELCAPVLVVGLLWFYDFLANSWVSSNSLTIDMVQEDSVFNGFGVNTTFIIDRLASLFFTNFTWLIILCVLAGFVVGCIRHKKSDSDERTYMLFEIIAAAVVSLIPLLFFITYNHFRYAAPTVILLVLLLPEAFDRMFSGCRVRAIVCTVLAACSLAQCYITIDPVMHLCLHTFDKGEGKIASTDNSILVKGSTSNTISVDSQYNREIMYFDRTLDQLLEEIKYDENTCILMSGEYIKPSIGQYVGTEYLVLGFGYPHMEKARYICFDAERGVRYLSANSDDAINLFYVNQHLDIYEALKKYDRCVFISFAFSNEKRFEHFMTRFNHERIAEKTVNGWTVWADLITD